MKFKYLNTIIFSLILLTGKYKSTFFKLKVANLKNEMFEDVLM
jgi:hypothetical protein